MLIRSGVMAIVAATSFFFLHVDAWIWLLPVVMAALVVLRWATRPPGADEY